MQIFCITTFQLPLKMKIEDFCGDHDDVGSTQPLQLFRQGGMDDDALHPADRPPFICGLISDSAVTSSSKKA